MAETSENVGHEKARGLSKPELCQFCRKRFRTKDALQSHIRFVHWMEENVASSLRSSTSALLGSKLHVAFEDDWLAVVVKPQGVPTLGKDSLDRADWLLKQLRPTSLQDRLSTARPVHRLDSGTGGLVVVAKTKESLRLLSDIFAHKLVHKRYRALVRARLEEGTEGECSEPLYGKPSKTTYKVVAPPVQVATTEDKPEWVSTLDVWPTTGRRHQIRRHLQIAGWPILGDRRYGGRVQVDPAPEAREDSDVDDDDGQQKGIPMCLWALALSFPHPARHHAAVQENDPEEQHAANSTHMASVAIDEPTIFERIRQNQESSHIDELTLREKP